MEDGSVLMQLQMPWFPFFVIAVVVQVNNDRQVLVSNDSISSDDDSDYNTPFSQTSTVRSHWYVLHKSRCMHINISMHSHTIYVHIYLY